MQLKAVAGWGGGQEEGKEMECNVVSGSQKVLRKKPNTANIIHAPEGHKIDSGSSVK